MGLAIHEIPLVADLAPVQRRDLARWLRSVVPRGEVREETQLQQALDTSVFAGRVRVADLVAVQWLQALDRGYHADTYARRIAAGAVDGSRMTLQEAFELAQTVRERARTWAHQPGARALALRRLVLYGSAVRSEGNLKNDIGDLDLALELHVECQELASCLRALPVDQQWRVAVQRVGLDQHLMQGDDRVTVAGSLSKVLTLFERQTRGLDLPEDGRKPCAYVLWTSADETLQAPGLRLGLSSEVQSAGDLETSFLKELCAQTLAQQGRAQQLHQQLNLL